MRRTRCKVDVSLVPGFGFLFQRSYDWLVGIPEMGEIRATNKLAGEKGRPLV